jgi:Cd2+/Zn2+-exporting ATPase
MVNETANSKPVEDQAKARCLARSVVSALADDPTLEAVTFDRARHTISVATLGQTDVPRIAERINSSVSRAQAVADPEQACSLLAGTGDCQTCVQPLSEQEGQRITIQHQGELTTIARVTCPTAPKFWRWRDLPWPKVVQRDVEFLEHAEEIDEWKPQLAAAVLCGLFGLSALAFHDNAAVAQGAYLLAYLSGSWYTAQ